MTYSALERFKDSIKGSPRDRVPIFPLVGGWVTENFSDFPLSKVALDPELIADAQIKARESVGYDPLYAYADALYIAEAFGCRVRFLETGPLADPLPLTIACEEDIDKIPHPDVRKAGRLPVFLEAVQRLSEYGRGDFPVIGLFEGPFTTTCRIIEAELIMRMVIKNRPILEVLLDRINETLLEFGHELVDSGANIIIIPEPTSSSSMISPSIFRQIVLPRLQRLTSKLNVPCILHICGDTYSMLEAMEQTGADVLSLDQCMNLSESRARIPKAVLGGNVDPIKSLLMGTKEQVVADTLNCLRGAGTSRFILMSGCGTPPKAPVQNVEAMVRTATEYGLGAETKSLYTAKIP